MDLPRAGGTAAIFAMAGVFWLGILIGLGSVDPSTRHDIAAPFRRSVEHRPRNKASGGEGA